MNRVTLNSVGFVWSLRGFGTCVFDSCWIAKRLLTTVTFHVHSVRIHHSGIGFTHSERHRRRRRPWPRNDGNNWTPSDSFGAEEDQRFHAICNWKTSWSEVLKKIPLRNVYLLHEFDLKRLEVGKMSVLLSLMCRNGGVALACYGISAGFRSLSETSQCALHLSGSLWRTGICTTYTSINECSKVAATL